MLVELVRQLGRASHKGTTNAGGEHKRISVDQLSNHLLMRSSIKIVSEYWG